MNQDKLDAMHISDVNRKLLQRIVDKQTNPAKRKQFQTMLNLHSPVKQD